MRLKIAKLNFKDRWSEVKNIQAVECPTNLHPRCHGLYIPTYEGQNECLLCTIFKSKSPPH